MGNTLSVNKNNSIEFFRFFFMVILVSWHCRAGFFAHGYLVVEFFFILSGYFIYHSFESKQKDTFSYVGDRIKRTYLEYSIACVLTFGIKFLGSFVNGNNIFNLKSLFKFISELLLLQNVGIFDGGYNYPLWYFSVLIWGGGGLYALLKYNKPLAVNIILPLYILLFYTYTFGKQPSIECWEKDVFYLPMQRGLADMSVGIMTAKLSSHILSWGGVKLKLFNGIALLSLLFTIAIMTLPANEDKYCLVFIPIFLLNSINHKGFIHKIFDHKIFSYLGGMTFEMYLLHAPLLMICSHIFPKLIGDNKVILFVSYLIVILIMSLIFKRVCKLINARLFRNDKQS